MMGQRCFSSYESNFSLKDEQRVVSWCLSIVPAVDCCLKHRCPGLHQCSVEDSPRRQAMNQGQWVRGEFFTVLEFDGGCFRGSVNSYPHIEGQSTDDALLHGLALAISKIGVEGA